MIFQRGWAAWIDVTTCTKSCEGGTLTRKRTCDTVDLSQCGGLEEEEEENHPCNEGACNGMSNLFGTFSKTSTSKFRYVMYLSFDIKRFAMHT